ncbi:MAG: ankyrin repeat domain-containing protein [Steroidobacteraceae bacterium]|nr:ankyrin repeat domain-containing protein [Steroidobacteraceae bacterium]
MASRAAVPVLALILACAMAAPAHSVGSEIARAAEHGDTSTVRALIRQGVDVNAPGWDSTPALHWVVRMQDRETTRLLLRAGADANHANRYGVRPLHLAIRNRDVAMTRLLLEAHARPDSTDATGETCLMMAAREGNVEIVKLLLDRGAPVDGRDPEYQQTPLMLAARYGNADVVRLLLQRGAQVDAQTRTGEVPRFRPPSANSGSKGAGIVRGGWPERGERDPVPGAKTPLLYAAREGHLEIAQLLLDAGADLEKADADGVSPLLMAILNERLALAKFFIERGANVNVEDWYGQTPLFAAVDVRNLDVPGPTRDNGVDREAAFELIKLLLERGANPNARTREYPPQRRWITRLGSLSWVDFTGQTPFLRAALAGDVKVMRLLLEHGADPNIPTFNGTTPLMAAAGINWTVAQTYDEGPAALLEAVRLAHSLGNDVNAVNSMGLRAIHGAANRGSDDIIRYLVENGAALDVADNQGRTPLTWAQGVFLATHPPQAKPTTIALLKSLQGDKS